MLARQALLPNTKWPQRRWCKTQPHPEAKREGRIRSSLVINTLGPSASTAHGEGKHGRVNQPPPASLPLHAALKKRGHQAAVVSILFHFLFSKKVNPTPLQGTPGGNTHGPCPEGLPGSPWFTYIFVTHACVHTCQGSNPGNGVAGLLPSYYSLLTSKDRSGRPHSSVPRETITSHHSCVDSRIPQSRATGEVSEVHRAEVTFLHIKHADLQKDYGCPILPRGPTPGGLNLRPPLPTDLTPGPQKSPSFGRKEARPPAHGASVLPDPSDEMAETPLSPGSRHHDGRGYCWH